MIGRRTSDQNGGQQAPSDAQLVQAARAGDKRAFVEIVARNQAMVCGVAYEILGDFAESEDAGQETFINAWHKLGELREPERLRSWLAHIARNAALGRLRKSKPNQPLVRELELVDGAPRPDQAAVTAEEARLVRQTLEKLPETYRLPLILYYREGQSVQAVAQALDLSEDAVKQRLARGRELCRDRMSNLLEDVLTRTRPNAGFTIAVAVALGALAAPAAIAGAAFAAAAGTTAGSAAAGPVLTIMSSTKTAVATALIVAGACIPLGFFLGALVEKPPVTVPIQRREATADATRSLPDFDQSLLFAEWRELHLRYGTNAGAMPVLHKVIGESKDTFHRQALRAALISEWADVDPAGAFAFFLAKGANGAERRQFFQEWLDRNPKDAVDALLHADGPGLEDMWRDNLKEIARREPARLAELVSKLPKPDSYWDKTIREAFSALAESGLPFAMGAAKSVTGSNRDEALAGVAQSWAKNDMAGALAWARGLPDDVDRDEIVRAALLGVAGQNPAAALDQAQSVPSGERQAYFATSTGARILMEASRADFDATVAWLTAHPGRLNRADLEGLAEPVTERLNADPAAFLTQQLTQGSLQVLLPAVESALLNEAGGQRQAVWDWLKTQPPSPETKALREGVLSSAGYQDPNLALQLVLDIPENKPDELQHLAQALLNGGSMLHRFDQLFTTGPQRLKQPLLESAFSLLRPDEVSDPEVWAGRLTLLPKDSQTKAIESLASVWASQNPEEAVTWALALPHDNAQNQAVSGIARAWTRRDPNAAAEWLASLPAGSLRDSGVASFVSAAAETYPRQAWDWALSIGDEAQRAKAATQVATTLAKKDPVTARLWIESSSLSPELKLHLQNSVQNSVAGRVR